MLPSLGTFLLGPDYLCSNRAFNQCSSPRFEPLYAKDYVKEQLSKKTEQTKTDTFIDNLYDELAKKTEKDTIRVVHMSDVHLDFNYTPGTDAACNVPICCNKENGFTSDPSRAAGYWGDIRCDIPERVYQSMLDFVKS